VSIFFIREHYRHGEGLLYRLDPCVKLLVTVLFAFAITLVPEGNWPAFAGFGLFVVAAILLSGLPPAAIFGRAMLALPFVAVALPLLFTRPGEPLVTLPLLGWTITDAGAVAVASILLKSWLTVLLAVVLTSVTKPLDLIRALERLRTPRLLVATVLFMYRYLFVIGEEAHRLMRARDARSAAGPGRHGGSAGWRARVLGSMVGALFLRSYERSEHIYAAMQARGYDGTIRFAERRALTGRDRAWLAVALILLLGLTAYARI
jgi:cobalt/nickel transport system permease protein